MSSERVCLVGGGGIATTVARIQRELEAMQEKQKQKETTTITLDTDAIEEKLHGRFYKKPLRPRLRTSTDGRPLRTNLAVQYPNLTRRERRQLLRVSLKSTNSRKVVFPANRFTNER